MTPVLKSLFIITFFSLLLIPGKVNAQTPKPTGGSCSYKLKIYPATVISVDTIDSIRVFIFFSVAKQYSTDTISYYRAFHTNPKSSIVAKYDLRVGNVFSYEVREIVSGHCSPHIESLTLNKYVAPVEKPK